MRSRDETTPGILTSHLGYPTDTPNAVIAVLPTTPQTAELIKTGQPPTPAGTESGVDGVVALVPGVVERVAGWTGGPYCRIPLPDELAAGTYVVRVVVDGLELRSEPFVVAPERLHRQTMSDVLAYFKAMRSSGEIDRKDRTAHFWDDPTGPAVDARGGWLDASGDTSKFLSHLTYTSMMSPQQIPLCAWAMLAARDELTAHRPALVPVLSARLRDEALWGADFLTRFRSPDGYFYTGIFDALTKRLEERVITAPLQNSVRTTRYQAAYRHGGGLAIAALARASTVNSDGDHPRTTYLSAARQAFTHLETHNHTYLFDNTESIIDDYTALLAATELTNAERTAAAHGGAGVEAAAAARRRVRALVARYASSGDGPGWFRGDEEGRPFFHAVEPGLPVVALLRFAEVLGEAPEAGSARETAVRVVLDVLASYWRLWRIPSGIQGASRSRLGRNLGKVSSFRMPTRPGIGGKARTRRSRRCRRPQVGALASTGSLRRTGRGCAGSRLISWRGSRGAIRSTAPCCKGAGATTPTTPRTSPTCPAASSTGSPPAGATRTTSPSSPPMLLKATPGVGPNSGSPTPAGSSSPSPPAERQDR